MQILGFALLILLIVVCLVLAGIIVFFIKIWVRATVSGASVSFYNLIGMKLRNIPPQLIVDARIRLVRTGLNVSTNTLETNYLRGVNIARVVEATVAAHQAGYSLSYEQASAIDRAGRDILDAVNTSVQPRVIDCPDPSKGAALLDAVAKDGIRMLVKARVTVRTNLERLVGGATQETIIARVGQGIVSAIGSSETYKDVLANPDHISRKVLQSGLASQTAFEIVSIDIADVSVAGVSGTREVANVGALLQTERAEADKKMRQAEAEGLRAMAAAREQEMRARVQEMQAKVVEAQAEVPMAIAEALRKGKLGVMDFLRMQNIMADTSMRESLGTGGEEPPPPQPKA